MSDEKIAILSDTHANLEALTLALNDIHARGIKKIWHLGDIIGYGPNPVECLELAQKHFEVSLAGNHEIATRAKIYSPAVHLHGFSGTGAVDGIHWATRQLYGDKTPIQKDHAEKEEHTRQIVERAPSHGNLIEYMKKLHVKETPMQGVLVVHDNEKSPGDMKYMLPNEKIGLTKLAYSIDDEVFERLNEKGIKRCFFGHSHMPGEYQSDTYPGIKIVNVGSVGLPRVGNFAATYAIWHPEAEKELEFVELPLDWQATNKKMIEAGLPEKLRCAHEKLSAEHQGELD